METEPHNVANPLTIDTSQMHAVADDDPSSANNFLTDSPTTALGTYPAPPAQQMNMDSEKFQVEDEHQSPPIFTATGPKLSLSRSHTTSYQKQTFRMDAGINPAETIADRLEAWRGVLKILVSCLLCVALHMLKTHLRMVGKFFQGNQYSSYSSRKRLYQGSQCH
jgi:hypothetical protein